MAIHTQGQLAGEATARSPNFIDQVESRLNNASERMSRLNYMVNRMIDQVIGQAPTPPTPLSPGKISGGPQSILDCVDLVETRLSELESTLTRMTP